MGESACARPLEQHSPPSTLAAISAGVMTGCGGGAGDAEAGSPTATVTVTETVTARSDTQRDCRGNGDADRGRRLASTAQEPNVGARRPQGRAVARRQPTSAPGSSSSSSPPTRPSRPTWPATPTATAPSPGWRCACVLMGRARRRVRSTTCSWPTTLPAASTPGPAAHGASGRRCLSCRSTISIAPGKCLSGWLLLERTKEHQARHRRHVRW